MVVQYVPWIVQRPLNQLSRNLRYSFFFLCVKSDRVVAPNRFIFSPENGNSLKDFFFLLKEV